eukprot:14842546-Alexandrium_andersonii.AAC.1
MQMISQEPPGVRAGRWRGLGGERRGAHCQDGRGQGHAAGGGRDEDGGAAREGHSCPEEQGGEGAQVGRGQCAEE